MKTVSKAKLKAKMLEYFRQVEATGEPLVVTDRGREVLEVRALKRSASTAEVLESFRRGGKAVGEVSEEELMRPLPLDDWEVMREDDRNPW